jgi:hypothetical protein
MSQHVKIELFEIFAHELRAQVDPLNGALWGCEAIQESDVMSAVSRGEFETQHWDGVKDELHGPDSRDFHIRRIAFFVHTGLPDDNHRIRLGVDAADQSPIRIDNGNHRLAAAFIRQEPTVRALLYYFDASEVAAALPSARRIDG